MSGVREPPAAASEELDPAATRAIAAGGPRRVVLAAGGTAGHIYPALAVAEALLARGDCEVLFVGTRGGLERRLLGEHGLPLALVPGRPWQHRSPLGKGRAAAAALAGFFAARRLLRHWRAEAVLGFGGYASIGTVLAGRSLGMWTAIVEGNAELGLANRLLARRVDRIYAAGATCLPLELESRTCRSGLPLRASILAAVAQRRSPRPGQPCRVLVLADPAHSDFLDRRGPELLAAVAARGGRLSIHHQTAATAVAAVRQRYGGLAAEVSGYLDDIGPAYAVADFAVCRAGANSLAELAACGLPALLVPLSSAAEGHQDHNAEAHAGAGAALVAAEAEWDRDELAARAATLLCDPTAWSAMSQRASARAAPAAAKALLDDLEIQWQLISSTIGARRR